MRIHTSGSNAAENRKSTRLSDPPVCNDLGLPADEERRKKALQSNNLTDLVDEKKKKTHLCQHLPYTFSTKYFRHYSVVQFHYIAN